MINNVRKIRILREMTQKELADRAGIGQATISNIENGAHIPGVDTALMIARALNCTVDELFLLEEVEK